MNIGRRDAETRIGHLFCEIHLGLKSVGLADRGEFVLPITQDELGDTMGLSTVHVNRCLQVMRVSGLVTFKGGRPVVARLFQAEKRHAALFIDAHDGKFPHHDEEGHDLPDDEAARKAALDALPDTARDKIPDGDRHTFRATARDEHGNVVYSETLTLESRRGPAPAFEGPESR